MTVTNGVGYDAAYTAQPRYWPAVHACDGVIHNFFEQDATAAEWKFANCRSEAIDSSSYFWVAGAWIPV